jgi:MFS family permease
MQPEIKAQIDHDYKYNFTVNLLDVTMFWFGASFFATRTVAPLFLSYLTDSTLAFGLLSMMVSTGWLLPQLFTANWVQSLPIKKIVPVKYGFYTQRMPIFLLPLAAWLALRSELLAAIIFLILMGWHLFGAGFTAVGWQDMIAKLFSVERRGRFFGVSQFSGTAIGVAGSAVAAWLLEEFPFPTNFVIAFSVSGLFVFLSWVFLKMAKEPAVPPSKPKDTNRNYWKSLPAIIKTDHNFRRYLTSQFMLAIGTMAVGFFTVYTVQTWDVADSMVGFFTTFMLAGQAGSNLIFGWLADKFGHKLVLEITALTTVLSAGIALLAPAPHFFYLVFTLQGISQAGFILSGIMIVFEFCEEDVRPTYIGLTSTAIGIFSGLAPLFGMVLIDYLGYTWLFAASLAFSLAGMLLLRLRVKEPRYRNLPS